jgi:hypothetical protein
MAAKEAHCDGDRASGRARSDDVDDDDDDDDDDVKSVVDVVVVVVANVDDDDDSSACRSRRSATPTAAHIMYSALRRASSQPASCNDCVDHWSHFVAVSECGGGGGEDVSVRALWCTSRANEAKE